MEFIRTLRNSIFDIYNPHGKKLLTRLCLGFSHLNEHRFKHVFNNSVNSIWICGGDVEYINHFFLHCPEYYEARQTFDNIQSIDKVLLIQNKSLLSHLLPYFFLVKTLNATPMLMHSFLVQYVKDLSV